MHKKILRIFSLALAILLLVSVLPQNISASEAEISEIRQQIISTYKLAKRYSGRDSFSGYCASLVNWQLYLMGITKEKLGNNGNQEYDYFCNLEYTSGGYRVHAYSATRYTMEEALNQITKNGTRNAYNILVGFQRTRSGAGLRYGHALLVHAVIDGIVYYSENSSIIVAGKYYAEGTPIAVPIKDFCQYYASWEYEGLICFGQKTYADECEFFPSHLYANVTADTEVYSSPCTDLFDDRSKFRGNVKAGERIHVIGLYRNTQGEYWYEVDDGHTGFIRADQTEIISMDYSDILAAGVTSPSVLRSGSRYGLKGEITSVHNQLYSLRAQVYSVDGDKVTQVFTTSATVDGHEYSLTGSSLSNNLAFRKLSTGTYLYKLAAVVGNYYYKDGTMQLEWKTLPLYTSQFEVVSKGGYETVIFDANGGSVDINQKDIQTNSAIGTLPIPKRDGYLFAGWYTAPEGGQLVSDSYIVSADMVLYARWDINITITGWYVSDGIWHYVSGGSATEGFVTDNGITYYTDSNGVPVTGWKTLESGTYYFNYSGAMQTGLLTIDGNRYYFDENGVMQTGWLEVEGSLCYFSEKGVMCFGWITIGGKDYFFDIATGKLTLVRDTVIDNSYHTYS